MGAKTYTVAGPSELHLGPDEVYLPGEAVELTREAAAPLLADGVVTKGATAGAREKDPPPPRPEGEALQAAIRAAIEGLDLADKSTWTKGGKPEVKALEARLGFDISAAERDEAWTAVEAGRAAG